MPSESWASFNGATARRPWKATEAGTADDLTTSFNGATARRPWKESAAELVAVRAGWASTGPRPGGRGKSSCPARIALPNASFNGATARRPWKAFALFLRDVFPRRASTGIEMLGDYAASTGPRPGGRGKSLAFARMASTSSACFNGATARRPWKGGDPALSQDRANCFNGATARRPWKASSRIPAVRPRRFASTGPRPGGRGKGTIGEGAAVLCERLQRGHGPEAVERGWPCGTGSEFFGASTGPRPGGRGKWERNHDRRNKALRFNGATARRPWKASPTRAR